jgi:hypothetical protein
MYTTNIGQEPPLPTTVAFTIMSWRISKPANILACPFCDASEILPEVIKDIDYAVNEEVMIVWWCSAPAYKHPWDCWRLACSIVQHAVCGS